MPAAELADWREARAADGRPLPDPALGHVAVHVVVDDVTAGGALLALTEEANGLRYAVLVVQTTIPPEAVDHWATVARALEADARARGVTSIVAAVDPGLTTAFGRAGFQATMLGLSQTLDLDRRSDLLADRRVSVRPMTADERRRFAVDARDSLLSGMVRAGVAEAGTATLGPLDERLAALAADPPPEQELLLTATVDDQPVGGAWSTLVPRDGGLDLYGHVMLLHPEHRGQGLSTSFLGAMMRVAADLGVVDVYNRVYGHDEWARHEFLPTPAEQHTVDDVFVRKDLA